MKIEVKKAKRLAKDESATQRQAKDFKRKVVPLEEI